MVLVTPGVDFIIYHLVRISVPSGLFAISLRALGANCGYPLPTWALVFGTTLFVPVAIAARIIHKSFDEKRQAAAVGARLPTQVKGKRFGNLDVLLTIKKMWDHGYPAEGLTEILQETEHIANVRVLWSDQILTAHPEHIKAILATDFNNYVKGERFRENMFSVLGSGVFNSDAQLTRTGEMWKFHRSMTRPFFTRDRISDFELFDRHADTAIALIKERMRSGYAIDFQDLMSRFTLDSASEFLFGHCVHSLTAGLPYPHNASYVPPDSSTPQANRANEFARAFLEAQEVAARRERLGWVWPLTEIMADKTKEPMRIVNEYLDPIVQEAIAKKQAAPKLDEKEVEDGQTLIDHLVSQSSVHLRLREEVLATVGPTRRPDYDDIRDMKYLRAVINGT
ncbi:hypothetical protein H0H81_001506 [Sphagnurus paluster]|uniref:Uncharacterized protein n=1 Tax=Sphagnurus paluster TaxID=117069 RepID=A0A9P7KKK4_9AGAR|nr:hypothetical protein H0H81_001506 [Sphagnurus paluster]